MPRQELPPWWMVYPWRALSSKIFEGYGVTCTSSNTVDIKRIGAASLRNNSFYKEKRLNNVKRNSFQTVDSLLVISPQALNIPRMRL